ncbi:hypothetical protein D3C81_1641290 [compost metagenome]
MESVQEPEIPVHDVDPFCTMDFCVSVFAALGLDDGVSKLQAWQRFSRAEMGWIRSFPNAVSGRPFLPRAEKYVGYEHYGTCGGFRVSGAVGLAT